MKALISKLKNDKFKINGNKKRIEMNLFLSFIKVPLVRSYDHLGSVSGWTQLVNNDHKLIIGGGFVDGVEYLDSIQYGHRLHNSFNNWVNPFFLIHIMTTEGKDFFIEYYMEDIKNIIEKLNGSVDFSEAKLKIAKDELTSFIQAFDKLKNS